MRNKHYLHHLIKQETPRIIFLQEIWLAAHDQTLLEREFPEYNFQIATPDIFENCEDKISNPGHTWHGAAIAWHRDLHPLVNQFTVTHQRFTAVIIGGPST